MLKTVLRVLSLLLSLAAISAQPGKPEEPRDIGSRLELFVDDYLIESMTDLELKLHPPRSAGKVLAFDQPWEGVTSAYISVFKDGDLYRMYYRGSSSKGYTVRSLLEPGERVIPEHPDVTCYAESRDGRNWIKPSLGLFEFQGSRANNIVWAAASSQCFMVHPVNGEVPPVKGRPRKLPHYANRGKTSSSGGELASARSCFSTVRTALGKLRIGLAGPVRCRSEFSTVSTASATAADYIDKRTGNQIWDPETAEPRSTSPFTG